MVALWTAVVSFVVVDPLASSGIGAKGIAYLTVGAFAERTVVSEQAAIAVDERLPVEVACLIGCCVSTGSVWS
jgi:Zn-dependent alcohol dehydrogenase